jgi:hypothetical protein
MDAVLIRVYCELVREHGCTADDILHHPELRQEYLSRSRASLGTSPEEHELLRRLSNLRKRSRLPRSRDIMAA